MKTKKPSRAADKLRPIVGRRPFFAWVMRRAGISDGQRMPGWAIALNLLLFPSRAKLWIGASVYDVASDTINTGTVRLPLHALERTFGKPSPPGHWFRVVDVHDGCPLIECRTDGYETPYNTRPVRTDGPPRDSGTHEAVVGHRIEEG